MDTVSNRRTQLSLSRGLWLSVMALFLVITVCFIIYQYRREKVYRADIIDTQLQTYNELIARCIDRPELWPENARVTILRSDGSVITDNVDSNTHANHLDRPEIQEALKNGRGRDIRRKSATVAHEYFYSATYFAPSAEQKSADGVIVRTALPYNHSLIDTLKTDKDFIWLSIAILIVLAVIYEALTQRIGRAIENKRRKMQNKLEKSEEDKLRIKRQLTQNVAHELKTPVSSIQGFLDILVNDDSLPQEQRDDFLKRCHSQATRLANILRDISILTRIDDATATLEQTDCNLHEIVESVATDLGANLNAHGDTIQNDIPPTLTIRGNYSLLYSIFHNLIDNSIAYAGDGITITIETQDNHATAAGQIGITYRDNGKGIPPQHLPYIFERFYRVDKGRSRNMGGTGLGLAIVKHAVLLHKGHIEAMAAPDGGLQFEFTLKK